jgi:hypothetical protein
MDAWGQACSLHWRAMQLVYGDWGFHRAPSLWGGDAGRARAGDGYSGCSAEPQLATLGDRYVSDGPARVACREGAGVAYPAGAPGFAYDPTGAASAAGSPHSVCPCSKLTHWEAVLTSMALCACVLCALHARRGGTMQVRTLPTSHAVSRMQP